MLAFLGDIEFNHLWAIRIHYLIPFDTLLLLLLRSKICSQKCFVHYLLADYLMTFAKNHKLFWMQFNLILNLGSSDEISSIKRRSIKKLEEVLL